MTPQPQFKFLVSNTEPVCGPGELIRINLKTSSEWALVGQKSDGLLPILVIGDTPGAAHFRNTIDGDRLHRDYDDPVLCFGQARVVPDFTDRCDVHAGSVFEENGCLILTATLTPKHVDSWCCLRADFHDNTLNPGYLGLQSWNVSSEPGGYRVAFRKWSLFLEANLTDRSVPVIRFTAA
jgi:hypothetical protein